MFHDFHDAYDFFYLPKDHKFVIQTFSLRSAGKKLEIICVWSSICCGQDDRTCMPQNEVVSFIFFSLHRFGSAASAIMACEITILAHESWNNSVKEQTLIPKSLLSSARMQKYFVVLEFCLQIAQKRCGLRALHCLDVEEHGYNKW